MPPQPAWLSQLRMDALPLAEQLRGWSQPRGEVIKSTGFECKLSEAGAVFFFSCIYSETSTVGSWFMMLC